MNGIYALIKGQRQTRKINKQKYQVMYSLKETHFVYKDSHSVKAKK